MGVRFTVIPLICCCLVGVISLATVGGLSAFSGARMGSDPRFLLHHVSSRTGGAAQGAGTTRMFFGTTSGSMPKLYDGWFKKTGQIERDMIAGTKSALRKGKPVEVCFFPVPNFDEVKFGTPTNQAFGKEVAKDLGMGEYKPGSTIRTYLVEFSNVYWAKKLADGLGGTVWVATTDGLKKDKTVVSKPGKAKFCSLRKPETMEAIKKGDTVIVVSPGTTAEWQACASRFSEQKLVFLNGLLNEGYEVGGPLMNLEQGYYLKRVSKGYIFRCSPSNWKAYLEKPDGGVEVLETYKEKPLLRDAAKVVREESLERFGVFNDRWTNDSRFGGRL